VLLMDHPWVTVDPEHADAHSGNRVRRDTSANWITGTSW